MPTKNHSDAPILNQRRSWILDHPCIHLNIAQVCANKSTGWLPGIYLHVLLFTLSFLSYKFVFRSVFNCNFPLIVVRQEKQDHCATQIRNKQYWLVRSLCRTHFKKPTLLFYLYDSHIHLFFCRIMFNHILGKNVILKLKWKKIQTAELTALNFT